MHTFARIEIGSWPSPIVRLQNVSNELGADVHAKLEEGPGAWGGNKVRKLEYLLATEEARAARTLFAFGAGSSSWAAAVALHGSALGWRVAVALAGHVPRSYADLYRASGTDVTVLPHPGLLPAAASVGRARAGRGVHVLPAGGSGGRGDIGSVRAGTEIGAAIRDGVCPLPSAVYVAAGTGGTAAGVAVGTSLAGACLPVVAVRVTPRPLGTQALVRRRARALIAMLGAGGCSPVAGDDRFFSPGYGRPNEAAREAVALARLDDLALDLTYGAKAFAALVADARAGGRGPFLFLHTSPGPLATS